MTSILPRPTRIYIRYALVVLGLLVASPALHAQHQDSPLSDGEVEKLRDSAYVPADRILVFIKFLDQRTDRIQDLYAHPRKPGREEDTHDLIEQFTAIADELEDNLDDYGPHHRDIRRSLPKLVAATERWATILKTPPDNEEYSVSRKLALESIRDLREDATSLIDQQKTYFAAHPDAVKAERQRESGNLSDAPPTSPH
jgi:hypothetical protein